MEKIIKTNDLTLPGEKIVESLKKQIVEETQKCCPCDDYENCQYEASS